MKSAQELADELQPIDIHFRKECDGFFCGAVKSWKEGFLAGYAAAEPRLLELAEKVKQLEAMVMELKS